jgi:hypothetical protein
MPQAIRNYRRYCLLKRQWATNNEETAMASLWQAKQEAESGSDLPATFPFRERLAACFYTTSEDLDGADVAELADLGAFTTREAQRILTAFNAL